MIGEQRTMFHDLFYRMCLRHFLKKNGFKKRKEDSLTWTNDLLYLSVRVCDHEFFVFNAKYYYIRQSDIFIYNSNTYKILKNYINNLLNVYRY